MHKVNLIRSRCAPVELKPPLFDPSKWMLHAFPCNPETVGNGLGEGGVSGRVVLWMQAEAKRFPSPLPTAVVVRKDAGR